MFRIDTSDAAAVAPTVPAAGTEGYYQEGNRSSGLLATKVPAWWLNMIQEELRGLVVGAGHTPSKTDNTQVLAAVNVRARKAPLRTEIAQFPVGTTYSNATATQGWAGIGYYSDASAPGSFLGDFILPTPDKWDTITGVAWYGKASCDLVVSAILIDGNTGTETTIGTATYTKTAGLTTDQHDLTMGATLHPGGNNQLVLRVSATFDGTSTNDGFQINTVLVTRS